MIICIGPVCIPVWGLIPFFLLYARTAWAWLVRKLSPAVVSAPAVTTDQEPSTDDKALAEQSSVAAPGDETAVSPKPPGAVAADGIRQRPAAAVVTAPGVSAVKNEKKWESTIARGTAAAPVFVAFTAPWCKPCKALMPVFEELSAGVGTFATLDADDFQELAMELGVAALPTYKVFEAGACVDTMTMATEQKLRNFVAKHQA